MQHKKVERLIKPRIIFLVLVLVGTSFTTQAQMLEELEIADNNYQACQDTGASRLDCARQYLVQMDKLMTLAYSKKISSLGKKQKKNLKKQQAEWLEKKESYFKQIEKDHSGSNPDEPEGNESFILAFDSKAKFVRKRAEELMADP